jgi:hypothetical protein
MLLTKTVLDIPRGDGKALQQRQQQQQQQQPKFPSKIKRSLTLGCIGTSARPVLTTLPGSRMSGRLT